MTPAVATSASPPTGAGEATARITVIGRPRGVDETGTPEPSRSLRDRHNHVWDRAYAEGKVVEPPYDPDALARQWEISTILPQCVAARRRNIEGHGYQFVAPAPVDDREAYEEEHADEKDRAERFFKVASLDMPFTELMGQCRTDMDTVGWAGLELLRTRDGELAGLEHLPARTLRLCVKDRQPTLITRWVLREDGSEYVEERAWKRLRLYAQRDGATIIYFKEPGDPRRISRSTGAVLGGEMSGEDWADPELASELLWLSSGYCPGGPYPLPPWIATSPEIAGSRAASAVNYKFFEDNAIPPFFIFTHGARFKDGALERVKEKLESRKGADSFWKAMVLEAESSASGGYTAMGGTSGALKPSITIERVRDRQEDALFQGYDANNRNKVRSAMGVPPLFTAETQDFTRATASAALQVFEAHTCAPERLTPEDRINRHIMAELGILWWVFRFKAASATQPEDVVSLIGAAEAAGTGTPNAYASLLAKVGLDLPPIPGPAGNLPKYVVQLALQTGALVMVPGADGEITVDVGEPLAQDQFADLVDEVVERATRRAS